MWAARSVRRSVGAGLVTATCFAAAIIVGLAARRARSEAVALWVDPDELSIGSVSSTSKFVKKLCIHNRSSEDVVVARFLSTCACTSVRPESLRIPAHGSGIVELDMNLIPSTDVQSKAREWNVGVSLQPVIIDGTNKRVEAPWNISGVVRNVFIGVPSRVEFGDFILHKSSLTPRTFELERSDDCIDVRATSSSPSFTASVRRIEDSSYSVSVSLSENVKVGLHSGYLVLEAKTRTNVNACQLRVPVECRVVNDVHVEECPVYLGMRDIGDEFVVSMNLVSRFGSVFEITDIVADSRLRVDRVAGSNSRVRVVGLVSQEGITEATVEFMILETNVSVPYCEKCKIVYVGRSARAEGAGSQP